MFAKYGCVATVSQGQRPLTEAARLHGSERSFVCEGLSRGNPPRPGYRALVIDPSLTVRTILRVCLGRAGFLVVDFPDGVEALRWLRSPQALPLDVALVDTDTPKIDGFTLIQRVKEQPACTHIVLIMLSHRDGLLDRIKARVAGAHVYVVKPFRTQDLLREMQRILPALETD